MSRVLSFFLLGFLNFRSVFGGIIVVRVIILRGSSCLVLVVWLLWCLLGVKNYLSIHTIQNVIISKLFHTHLLFVLISLKIPPPLSLKTSLCSPFFEFQIKFYQIKKN